MEETGQKLKILYERQKLVADISQLLHSSTSPKQDFGRVLAMIGEHTDVSRVYIFENNQDNTYTSNTYEWCNQGVESVKDMMQNIRFDTLPGIKEKLMEDNHFFSPDLKELNPKTYAFLEKQNVKSLLAYPLYVENFFNGFIGFDECYRERTWNQDTLDLLRSIANIISNFIEKTIVMQRFRMNELRLNFAINSSNSGLWDWDPSADYVFHNKNYYKILGYSPEEYEDSFDFWYHTLHPEDAEATKELLYSHISGLIPGYEAVYRIICKEGTLKWILDKGMVVARDVNGKATRVTGIMTDITKQKEQELKFRELNNTKDKLLSIISHDLRGPIGNMLPILDMLTSNTEMEEEQMQQFLNYLKEASNSTFELLENLLLWSRSQADTISLKPEVLSLQQIINNNIKLTSTAARNKNISISIKSSAPLNIFADKESVNLIIRNILSNAIKFTPKGGKITLSTDRSGKNAIIDIMDNGTGIAPEILENIFTAKFSITTNSTGAESGSGLGLILCHDFAIKNRGKITARNRDEGGSIFTVTLPLEYNNINL